MFARVMAKQPVALAGWSDEIADYFESRVDVPVYPSALVTVLPRDLDRIVEMLERVRGIFIRDSTRFLIPECEGALIRSIVRRYNAQVEYGQAREWEFATKARAAGIHTRLVSLGSAVYDVTHMTADEMVRHAREAPELAAYQWRELYDAGQRRPH